MKTITSTLLKTGLFICLLTGSSTLTAQSATGVRTQGTKTETSAISIDTLSVTTYFATQQARPTINKTALIRGYRKTLRRQKDLYLIPWELRKKHLRIC